MTTARPPSFPGVAQSLPRGDADAAPLSQRWAGALAARAFPPRPAPEPPRVLTRAERALRAAMEAELARRPAFPYGADYQRRPIGGPTVCQDAGRAWGRIHGAQHRGPAMPVHGPLTERWARPGNVPRWYVWWRLLGVQDGHCATCPGPAEVVDHDHVTGLLRGLLCYDCNTTEAAHARALERGQHRGEVCWFASYWAAPPAAPFGWFWPDPARSTTTFFLPAPPAWAPRRVPRRLCSPFMCRMRARGLLLGR